MLEARFWTSKTSLKSSASIPVYWCTVGQNSFLAENHTQN